MNARNANIGLGVAVALMVVGVLIVGTNPSDAEMQLIFWPAFFTGIAVLLVIEGREERRERRRRSPR
jgi:hypothetical protein